MPWHSLSGTQNAMALVVWKAYAMALVTQKAHATAVVI